MQKSLINHLNWAVVRESWRIFRRYFSGGRALRRVETPAQLADFIGKQAAQVAQSTLYGYLKTRAGTSFPQLFSHSQLLVSINIAKWHVYLACVSDLAVYCGVLIGQRTAAPPAEIRDVVTAAVARVLAEAGTPREAGDAFAAAARAVHTRIAAADWDAFGDDESAFCESPRALVEWAPVADEFKSRDREIIRNSVRFRWQEIRRVARRALVAEILLTNAATTRAEKSPPARNYSPNNA